MNDILILLLSVVFAVLLFMVLWIVVQLILFLLFVTWDEALAIIRRPRHRLQSFDKHRLYSTCSVGVSNHTIQCDVIHK